MALVDATYRWPTLLTRIVQALVDCDCYGINSMSLSGYLCMPWLILHSVVRYQFPYAHKPRKMREDIG